MPFVHPLRSIAARGNRLWLWYTSLLGHFSRNISYVELSYTFGFLRA